VLQTSGKKWTFQNECAVRAVYFTCTILLYLRLEIQGFPKLQQILTKEHGVIWRKTTLPRNNEAVKRISVIVGFRVLLAKKKS
jgi:hypothetical protein